jgi:hypothetical protein
VLFFVASWLNFRYEIHSYGYSIILLIEQTSQTILLDEHTDLSNGMVEIRLVTSICHSNVITKSITMFT